MSSRSQKQPTINLPSFESSLSEKEREILTEKIGESVITSGAADMPPAANVPTGRSFAPALSAPPVEANHYALSANPLLSAEDAIKGLQKVGMGNMSMLQRDIDIARQTLASAPIETASAKMVDSTGRTNFVPSTVRDVPNKLIQSNSTLALERYWLLTEALTKKESDALTDLAAQKGFNQKPLMWLSEKLYWLLAVKRWTPARNSGLHTFCEDDANPQSQSFRILMETLGPDCGSMLLNVAERLDCGITDLVAACARELLKIQSDLVAANAQSQTAESWKRPE